MHWLDWEELAKSAWQNIGKLWEKNLQDPMIFIYIYINGYCKNHEILL
jgi:hypothetical protein